MIRKLNIQNRVRLLVMAPAWTLALLADIYLFLSNFHQGDTPFPKGAWVILGCLLFVSLLGLIASWYLTAPLRQALETLKDFNAGDHSARIDSGTTTVLAELASGINDMAATAQHSEIKLQEQVDEATQELRETLEEVEIKNVELDLARKRAQQASRVKSEFLANMSHEIRTPMNAIVGYSELLAKTHLGQDQREQLDIIRRSAASLLSLIEDVLNLSNIEAGKQTVQEIDFNLRELLEDAVMLIAPDAYEKELELILDLPPDMPLNLRGDALKLSRILSNLMNNAVKFTESGLVRVDAQMALPHPDRPQVTLTIRDTGIGMSAERVKEIFEPFSVLDTSPARKYAGMGLGLAISKQLLDALGGSLTVSSRENEGSEFKIVMPLTMAGQGEPAHQPEHIRRLGLYEKHPDMTAALEQRLAAGGFAVERLGEFQDVIAVSNLPDERKPDVLLLSLGYRDMHNSDNLYRLFENRSLPPVLALVNSLDNGVQRRIAASVRGPCLPKCIDTVTLNDELLRLVREHRKQRKQEYRSVSASLQGRNILIVEDNRINRQLIALQLRKLGLVVHEAESSHSATTLLTQHGPDLILLDMHLAGEDGLEVVRRLRTSRRDGDLPPILALSASSKNLPDEVLLQAGIKSWLVKPVEDGELATALTAALAANSPALTVDVGKDVRDAYAALRPEIRTILQEDLPRQATEIRGYWANRDLTALRHLAHVLHGTAAFCKMAAFKERCQTLEYAVTHGDQGTIRNAYEHFETELNRVLTALHGEDRKSTRE